jgi:hypothetical protein
VFEYHWGSFPLFTPEAFRYYIPGYLKHMLEHPQSEIAGWTIERLRDLGQPDSFWAERASLLSHTEREAIRAFLRYIHNAPEFARFRADSYDALACWEEH